MRSAGADTAPWLALFGCGQACRLQRFGRRAVDDVALAREHRAVARTVPRPVGVIPRNRATEVRTRGGQCLRRAVVVLPYGDLLLAALDHATAAGLDLVECVDDRCPRRAARAHRRRAR